MRAHNCTFSHWINREAMHSVFNARQLVRGVDGDVQSVALHSCHSHAIVSLVDTNFRLFLRATTCTRALAAVLAGKSALAKTLGGVVVSADDFCMVDGVYVYQADRAWIAHSRCQATVKKLMASGSPLVIVDNTNVDSGSMLP
jgi:ABC-type uncharacterized transport system ATPase subunit